MPPPEPTETVIVAAMSAGYPIVEEEPPDEGDDDGGRRQSHLRRLLVGRRWPRRLIMAMIEECKQAIWVWMKAAARALETEDWDEVSDALLVANEYAVLARKLARQQQPIKAA